MKINRLSLFTLGSVIWTSSLVLQYYTISDYQSLLNFRSTDLPIKFQAGGALVFILMALSAAPLTILRPFAKLQEGKLIFTWLIFLIFLLFSIPLSIDPARSFMYVIVLALLIAASYGTKELSLNRLLGIFWVLTVLILVLFVILFITLDFTGRTIGWIPPNNVGKIAFCMLVFGSFLKNPWRTISMLFALGVLLLVSSRGMLLSSVFFIYIRAMVLHQGFRIFIWSLSIGIAALSIVLFVEILSGGRINFISFIDSLFFIYDSDRGIGSGFTGRTLYWSQGTQLFFDNPLIGYGFRTRGASGLPDGLTLNAHSGWINMLLDIGVIGTSFIIAIIVISASNGYKIASRARKNSQRTRAQLGGGIFTFFCVIPIFWIFEPNYLNFGMIDIVPFFLLSAISGTLSNRDSDKNINLVDK